MLCKWKFFVKGHDDWTLPGVGYSLHSKGNIVGVKEWGFHSLLRKGKSRPRSEAEVEDKKCSKTKTKCQITIVEGYR